MRRVWSPRNLSELLVPFAFEVLLQFRSSIDFGLVFPRGTAHHHSTFRMVPRGRARGLAVLQVSVSLYLLGTQLINVLFLYVGE